MTSLWIRYSDEELKWIKAMAELPRVELHALFVQVWNRPDVRFEHIKALCTRRGWKTGRTGCFQKGLTPPNKGKKGHYAPGSQKGWFKKGHPRTGHAITLYKPIGTERITKDGYLERKINDDLPLQKRWRGVHRINFEAANGPVPDGHRLKCLDGDKLNVDPSNWEAIPYALGPRLDGRFGRGYEAAPPELRPLIMATAKLEHAARVKRKTMGQG